MTFSINLTNFRAFRETGDVKIAPITILTGTNSSGKSSFLGALKYLSDTKAFGVGGASFNKEPFLFGGFEQIVNNFAADADKSKSFSLGFSGRRIYDSVGFRRKPNKSEPILFKIDFAREGNLPVVKRVILSTSGLKVVICIDYKNKIVLVEQDVLGNTERFEIENDTITPELLFNNIALVSFVYEAAMRRAKTDADLKSQSTPRDWGEDLELYERAQLIRDSLSSVPSTSFAGAPIRSRPSRTYDPTDPMPQAEGSHVPSQLAQLARQNPREWAATKSALNLFGENSGLFDKIDVRELGDSESDPFQIEISLNGPKRNIVDVGYGVSQVFPLLFESLKRLSGELIMLQQPEVHLHPEAQAALGSFIVDDIGKKSGYYLIETHSDYLIDRIRQKVRAGNIKHTDVSLLYFSQDKKGSHIANVGLDINGDVVDPPENYREFFLREELTTLGF